MRGAECGVERFLGQVPELVKVLFDAFVERLSLAFDEVDLRETFQVVLDQVDHAIRDDVQMEFDFF